MTEDQFDAAHDAYQDVYDGDNHRVALRHAVLAAMEGMKARLEAEIVWLKDDVDTFAAWWKEAKAEAEAREVGIRALDEWHEDDGYAVWWTWQDGDWLGEPSYIGSPLCSNWPGYHTHWTPHPTFPPSSRAILTETRVALS